MAGVLLLIFHDRRQNAAAVPVGGPRVLARTENGGGKAQSGPPL